MLNPKRITDQLSRFMSIMNQKLWDLFQKFDFGEDVFAEIDGFDNASDLDTEDKHEN